CGPTYTKWTSGEKWRSGDAGAGAGRWSPSQASAGEGLRGARYQLEKYLREFDRPANRVPCHPITARLIGDQRDDLVAISPIVNAADPRQIRRRGCCDERD